MLYGLHRLRRTPGKRQLYLASLITMTFTLLSHSYNFGALLREDSFAGDGRKDQFAFTPVSEKRIADLHKVTNLIPLNASVVATTYMLAQISNRANVFDARRPYDAPEYIFFSSLELMGTARDALSVTLSHHGYALVATAGEFYLFRRGVESSETVPTLRMLGLIRDPDSSPPSPAPLPHGRPHTN